MRKRKYTISRLMCPGCENYFPIPRKTNRTRELDHIKDIYCPFCRQVQKMTEVRANQFIRNMAGEIIK